MLPVAGAGILTGWVRDAGSLDRWLILEVLAGLPTCLGAGALSRKLAGRFRASALLAGGVLTVGLAEAALLLVGPVTATRWLLPLPPVLGAAGVLLGGWLTGTRSFSSGLKLRDAAAIVGYTLPPFVLAVAGLASLLGLPAVHDEGKARMVASVLALDFTVTFPGLVYLLLVRTRRLPWIVILPAFVLGVVLAGLLLPPAHPAVLDLLRMAVIPAELGVVAYLVMAARRALAHTPAGPGDFVQRFRATARRALGQRVAADILTTEVAVLYFALRPRRIRMQGSGRYTAHRSVGYPAVLAGLLLVLAVETVAVHLLIRQWSGTAAWILTALSLYACLWLLGDFRAMLARPTRLTPTRLLVRLGLRWEVDVARDAVVAATLLRPGAEPPSRQILVVALLGQPTLRLVFRNPVEVIGMYGIRRTVTELWLGLDDAPALGAALGESSGGRSLE